MNASTTKTLHETVENVPKSEREKRKYELKHRKKRHIPLTIKHKERGMKT